MKKIYLKVALWVEEDADIDAVVSEMDYDFEHEDIVSTEIVDVEEVDALLLWRK